MSIKKQRKIKKDYNIYYDQDEIQIKKMRPNFYKKQKFREKLYRHLFKLTSESAKYRREIRIKGLDQRIAEEIALTRWL